MVEIFSTTNNERWFGGISEEVAREAVLNRPFVLQLGPIRYDGMEKPIKHFTPYVCVFLVVEALNDIWELNDNDRIMVGLVRDRELQGGYWIIGASQPLSTDFFGTTRRRGDEDRPFWRAFTAVTKAAMTDEAFGLDNVVDIVRHELGIE